MNQVLRWSFAALASCIGLGSAIGQTVTVLAARGSFQVVGEGAIARPFIALVKNSANQAVSNATVTFTAASSSGYFSLSSGSSQTATAVTDIQGLAEAPSFTAGPAPGQFQISAASGSSSTGFTITIVSADNLNLTVSPATACFYGETITLQATLTPSPNGGKVAFFDGFTLLGYGEVVTGGIATLRVVLPTPGTRHLSARYVASPFAPAASQSGYRYTVRALPIKAFAPAAWSIATVPTAVVVADFNKDGKQDLAVATSGGAVQVFLGNGDGTMTAGSSVTFASTITKLWALDVNADGFLDLIASDETKALYVALNSGTDTFAVSFTVGTTAQPNRVTAFADFDGDGYVDFVNENGVTYYGGGDGTFGALGAPSPTLMVFPTSGYSTPFDFNLDGVPDLAQATSNGINFFQGTGSGRFVVGPAFAVSALTVAADDFTGSGYYQVIGGSSGATQLAEVNNVAGNYVASTYNTPGSLSSYTLIDLNGDEILDVLLFVTLPGGADAAYVLYGNPDGSLQSPVAVNGPASPQSAVAADFNGDGIPDLAVTSAGGLAIQLGGAGGVFEVYNSNASNILPNGVLGQAYDTGITAAGGTRPYTFQVTGGIQPPGLQIVENRLNSGVDLFGTPTAGGQYTFTVTATDALGHTASGTFTISISNSPINFGTQTLPGAVVGQSYSYTFVVSGGIGALTFTYPNATPPPGLALNSNGTITGVPTVAGQYSIPVTVTDTTSQSASQTVSLFISASTGLFAQGNYPGVFRGGEWWMDFDGDDVWTQGVDLLFIDGQPGDIPVLGDWTNTGVQRYGIFRQGQWWINTSGDRTWTQGLDTVFVYGQPGDVPIVGDWDNTGRQRIGVFRGGEWWLDINGDNQWTAGVDTVFIYGQPGDIPVFGDWTNTGVKRIGIFRNGQWWLDINNDHQWTQGADTVFTYGQTGDTPIVGDWTGTGQTRIGVFRQGQWWLDINGDDQWTIGVDTVFTYGQPGDIPVLKRPPF